MPWAPASRPIPAQRPTSASVLSPEQRRGTAATPAAAIITTAAAIVLRRTGASLLGYSKLYGQVPGGQAEYLRVPQAHFGPIKVPEGPPDERFLYLSDVLPTSWQAVAYADVPEGGTVAVFGLGGVGLAAVAGAALAGATTVIAVDVDTRKCDAALERFGATHAICSKDMDEDAVIERVRELTGGFGADVTIDAVGIQPTWRQAFYARDLAGRMVMVGVPNRTDRIDVPAIDMYARGGSIKPAWYGDCLPERDFPAYVELYRQGRYPLGEFVSERIGIGDIEEAFAKMKRGDVLRSVVEF